MGDYQAGRNHNVYVWAGITLFLCTVLHFLYKYVFGGKKNVAEIHETESDSRVSTETSSETAVTEPRASAKNKKRSQWKGKTDFSHPWLFKNLKGHPGNVLLLDFSANGKFMAATCDETNATVDAASAAERRRRRDRRRMPTEPLMPSSQQRLFTEELIADLRPHLLSPKQMWALGYPLEIEPNSTKAVVYIHPLPRPRLTQLTLDVNAPEFIPGCSQSDSGRGSLGSTPRSESDEEADAIEHLCVRCDKLFRMTRESEYIVDETCAYHWGRISSDTRYMCCNTLLGSRGCCTSRFHVWTGTKPGMNGPLEGYVRAKSPRGGVYAIDAEMCYTAAGLELASIAVIGVDGRLVYKSLVKPSSPVVDHNTRFSGIRPRDLVRATKNLRDVQNDILGFIGNDTILIGHALDNDLRALKLLHSAVVDTCALYPHPRGFPMRRSLRALAEEQLGRSVQRSSTGHSPLEDARAAMDLVMLKINQDRSEQRKQTRSMCRIADLQPYDPLISSA